MLPTVCIIEISIKQREYQYNSRSFTSWLYSGAIEKYRQLRPNNLPLYHSSLDLKLSLRIGS